MCRIKAATAAVGFALGDLVAQLATKAPGEAFRYDVLRTARLALYGGELARSAAHSFAELSCITELCAGAIGGPIGHFWYSYLDQVVFPAAPKRQAAVVWPTLTVRAGPG